MRKINLTGRTFGMLTVIAEAVERVGGRVYWHCKCACGGTARVAGKKLVGGQKQFCSSLEHRRRHGHSSGYRKSRTYSTWEHMVARCTSGSTRWFGSYGGRGIRVCDRWMTFENFVADMGERPVGMTLDRIDNDGDYEPANCRWADQSMQSKNTRRAVFIDTPQGRLHLIEAAALFQIKPQTVRCRIYRGWSPEKAVSRPTRHQPEEQT